MIAGYLQIKSDDLGPSKESLRRRSKNTLQGTTQKFSFPLDYARGPGLLRIASVFKVLSDWAQNASDPELTVRYVRLEVVVTVGCLSYTCRQLALTQNQ